MCSLFEVTFLGGSALTVPWRGLGASPTVLSELAPDHFVGASRAVWAPDH